MTSSLISGNNTLEVHLQNEDAIVIDGGISSMNDKSHIYCEFITKYQTRNYFYFNQFVKTSKKFFPLQIVSIHPALIAF
jgi:hypothetical protein